MTSSLRALFVVSLVVVAGCDSPAAPSDGGPRDAFRPDAPLPDSGRRACTSDAECDDGVGCTRDVCDPDARFCRNTPDHPICDDGVLCNGVERCDERRGCMPGERETCDDGDVCSIDRCNEEMHMCQHFVRDLDDDGDPDFNCEGGGDCDDRDATRSSTLPEVCGDSMDNDCDTMIDEAGCGRPRYDTCADPLDISAGGAFVVNTRGATPDYPLAAACGTMRADVVLSFTLTEPRDVSLIGEGDVFVVALALRPDGGCTDRTTDLECRSGFPSRVQRRNLPAGRYFVIVSGGPGEVVVTATFSEPTPPAMNETCAMPTELVPGVRTPGSFVDVRDDVVTRCGFSGSPDLFYSFTTVAEQDVRIVATARTGESLAWEVRSACETPASAIRCAYGSPSSGTLHQLPAGTYYVIVEGPTFAEVDFDVSIEITAPTPPAMGDLCSSPIPLTLGTRTTGSLGVMEDDIDTSCGFRYRDIVYSFTLDDRSDVTIDIDGGGSFLNASVRPTCADGATQLRCTSGAPIRQRLRDLGAGTYFVIVESARAASVAITVTPDPPTAVVPVTGNESCTTMPVVVPETGGVYSGNTTGMLDDYQTTACGAMARSPDAVFALTLTSMRRVTASTDGSAFDTVLHMHQGTCTSMLEVACDDNSGEGSASFIERTLGPGTYYFVVDGWGTATAGPYVFEVLTYDP